MQRTLSVNLKMNTWPRGKVPPSSLLPATKQLSVDILDMMVRIGSLAIPVTSMEFSINAWWAWLRYASAFADGPGFLLKSTYVDLDAHQKSVLSDDFGMGVALSYLVSALDLQTVFDGRYFVQFLAPAVGAKALQIAKNGQFKSPDFIGQDSSGRWHAIECKGTQTSSQTRLDQIKAGRLQKTNVVFPPAVRGQKLISALLVGRTGGGFKSSLLIEDPEGDTRFRVRKDTLSSAEEAGRRATLARALGLIGYPAMAANIAAPYGQYAYDRETSGKEEQLRLEAVRRKRAALGLELERVERDSDRFTTAGHVGREIILSVPDHINTPKGRFTRIRARLAMPLPIFTSLREKLQNSEPAGQLDGVAVAGIKGVSAETSAKLTIGSIFEAEVELLR
ncbi:MAG: hypothetical protein E5Y06_23290 [Mesorhizobium sp.]|uniref:hypothetical protein n=1 Tax=Mesorhizobium sp. TaxID=1871066 RepID=UPI0011F7365E|nr:hypothetical protein [Mesorhizobium sp.]TIN92441.1 MAG: hypothetical protein E5Y06_23290 [Mesorhizobium sp.]TJU97836.1 MAG: hypothetical protein E5Y08_15645 [Mesorhizobium sp.]